MPGVNIVWYKHDLRACDHAALAAAERGTVLPLFIIEPALWRQQDYTGRHCAFAADCLIELRAQLSALGQPLVVRVGEAVTVLGGIANELPIQAVWSHEETGNGWTFQRDLSLKRFLAARKIPWHELPQNGVVRRLETRDKWTKTWEQRMREVVQATRLRRDQVRALPRDQRGGWPAALAAFEGRLHWHCHFIQKLESELRIEFENLHPACDGLRENDFDAERFDTWQAGQTGYPIVDACIRALRAGGWINFRMRVMLVSFSSYQLWLHWRRPALTLARLFTDYEPGIHYSQMQMQSGTTGINTLRIYNPAKQSQDHDPEGSFVRRWVPELAGVPTEWIHSPWQMPSQVQRQSSCVIGKHYPSPIVDHLSAAREARDRLRAVRGSQEARAQGRSIQQKHGSRRDSAYTSRARSKKKQRGSLARVQAGRHPRSGPPKGRRDPSLQPVGQRGHRRQDKSAIQADTIDAVRRLCARQVSQL